MLRFKRLSVFVAALLLVSSAFASNEALSTINELPAIEIPAKAAELVRSAPAEKQLDLSRSILVTVLKERPQMAVQMVATLSIVAPDSAPVIAVIAASIAVVSMTSSGTPSAVRQAEQYRVEFRSMMQVVSPGGM